MLGSLGMEIHLTSKRQATLPALLCDELGVGPGSTLVATRAIVKGRRVWVLEPPALDWSWFGAVAKYAKGKPHDLNSIRKSVARGRKRGSRA